MKDNFSLSNCGNNDVLSVQDKVFKVIQVKETLQKLFQNELSKELYNLLNSYGISIDPGGHLIGNKFYRHTYKFFEEGIDCEILKLGASGWQTGKVRINVTLEFIPDEPSISTSESPLDDLRRMINE